MIALVVLLHGMAACAAADNGVDPKAAEVDGLFESWNRPNVPGCAVGIVRDGELIYSRGFGLAHLDYEEAARWRNFTPREALSAMRLCCIPPATRLFAASSDRIRQSCSSCPGSS